MSLNFLENKLYKCKREENDLIIERPFAEMTNFEFE